MGNSYEKGPEKNQERKVTCPICNNKEPEKSNCGRCKSRGYIIIKI